jgi:hypothetical protein
MALACAFLVRPCSAVALLAAGGAGDANGTASKNPLRLPLALTGRADGTSAQVEEAINGAQAQGAEWRDGTGNPDPQRP